MTTGGVPQGPSAILSWSAFGMVLGAGLAAWIRWLRVAQREHYLPGSVSRFALRWWRSRPVNVLCAAGGIAGGVGALWSPWAALATVGAAAIGPLGLSLRGRTSKLVWTRRLKTLAVIGGVLWIAVVLPAAVGASRAVAVAVAAGTVVGAPLVVDLALALASPAENIAARRYVRTATATLKRVAPRVVAVTGSYGKTSTKNYIAHLLAGRFQVVASPASFNNTAGLSRAVNERLDLGTEVFIAEMGTYGPGEIAALCSWMVPEIAVITAIGPVHLERMRSEETVLRAKAEIAEHASVVVLNTDDPRLAHLADELESHGRTVKRAGATRLGAVTLPAGVSASNVACACEVARALGVPDGEIASRLGTVPSVPNRRATYLSEAGFTVIDDTYNSNPAGCREALALLATAGGGGRAVVVTPGMVELGRRQDEENRLFGAAVLSSGARLVVVGRSNRRALVAGARAAGASDDDIVLVRNRPSAVSWVRAHLSPGDVVLYENDLPDHFP